MYEILLRASRNAGVYIPKALRIGTENRKNTAKAL